MGSVSDDRAAVWSLSDDRAAVCESVSDDRAAVWVWSCHVCCLEKWLLYHQAALYLDVVASSQWPLSHVHSLLL